MYNEVFAEAKPQLPSLVAKPRNFTAPGNLVKVMWCGTAMSV